MEEKTKNNLSYVMLSIIMLSIGGTTGTLLTQDQFDNTYYCKLTEEYKLFNGGLSGTQQRGYPNEDNRKGYKDCRLGDIRDKWIPLEDYAEEIGVDPLSLIMGKIKPSIKKTYQCPPSGMPCVEVK